MTPRPANGLPRAAAPRPDADLPALPPTPAQQAPSEAYGSSSTYTGCPAGIATLACLAAALTPGDDLAARGGSTPGGTGAAGGWQAAVRPARTGPATVHPLRRPVVGGPR